MPTQDAVTLDAHYRCLARDRLGPCAAALIRVLDAHGLANVFEALELVLTERAQSDTLSVPDSIRLEIIAGFCRRAVDVVQERNEIAAGLRCEWCGEDPRDCECPDPRDD